MKPSSWVLVVGLAIGGCGGAAKPAPAPASGAREHMMDNCPNAVSGARTTVRDVDGGVAIEIVAPPGDGEARVRELARLHAAMGPPTGEHDRHTGDHGGPENIGHCPILHVGTMVTSVPIDGGARVTVLVVGDTSVDQLRSETRRRADALATP